MLCPGEVHSLSTNDQLFAQRMQVIPKEIVRVQTVPKTGAVVDTTAIVSEIECPEAAIPLGLRH
jgi:hypothetical protein